MADTYLNFKALESNEKGNFEIECIDRSSDIILIAPHGGCIESSTKNIAKSIADKTFNYYSFVGKRRRDCYKYLHITSNNFDEQIGVKLVEKSKTVIAIHGCKDEQNNKDYGENIFIGGRDNMLRKKLHQALKNASLPICSSDTCDSFPSHFKGKDPENICNRGKNDQGGVQFELTRAFRDDGVLCGKFIDVVRKYLEHLEERGLQ